METFDWLETANQKGLQIKKKKLQENVELTSFFLEKYYLLELEHIFSNENLYSILLFAIGTFMQINCSFSISKTSSNENWYVTIFTI